jgi:hypothetical protein
VGALLLGAGLVLNTVAKDLVLKTAANVMVEMTFTSTGVYADPFNEVMLNAIFVDPQGRELWVPGFWAGTNLWKVRYSSPVLGTHRFRTACSEPRDRGLEGVTGKIEIKPYEGQNPLYTHGPLRVSANRRYLEHADGTAFFWLGDTWWMGLCNRLEWPAEFKSLTADRKAKGFNVIQIVAGLYPDMHPFDPRGANETGFPWETNYARIRPEYFQAADERLRLLVDEGLTPCIFGSWGHYITGMGLEKTRQHWRYLIARYGAWPVVWCAAGEANLPWYLVKDFPFDDRKQARAWTEVMRFIRATDPFQRLLTVHPTGLHRLSSRNVTDDPALLDIDMLQTPHGQRDAVSDTVKNVRQSYADDPVTPVINGEASYEMLTVPKGVIPTEWTRRMFWLCVMNGAAGHTYGANGIWQCNRRDHPHGSSPTANSPATGYGTIPWDEAMNLPGSEQVGLGKKLFEQYRWQDFKPHPEWAEFENKSILSLGCCQWIWFPEGQPATNAPVGKRFFRRAFWLPEGKPIKSAQLRITADDQFNVRLNDETLGSGNNFKFGRHFNDLMHSLKTGLNILAVMAENMPAPGVNPAGLIARLEIRFADDELLEVISDDTWRCAQHEIAGWDCNGFDDTAWTNAMAIGCCGDLPWGKIDLLSNEGVYAPQSAGIADVVRMTYVPQADAIVLRNLDPKTSYRACCFDPVSGEKTAMAPVQANSEGSWTCLPPAGQDHDWVLILENSTLY